MAKYIVETTRAFEVEANSESEAMDIFASMTDEEALLAWNATGNWQEMTNAFEKIDG